MTAPASLPTSPEEAERWLPVVGWEGLYEVSDLNRIRSLDRSVRCFRNGQLSTRIHRGKLIIPSPNRAGYASVSLAIHGRKATIPVHRIVLEAFVGLRPDGMEACHADGDRMNARLDNLRWDTKIANAADRARHGNTMVGAKNVGAKLTEEQVRAIRSCDSRDRSYPELANEFGVNRETIGKIVRGETWKNLLEAT